MKLSILLLILLYQKLISPNLKIIAPTGGCKYTPTCSEYFIRAVESEGVLKGTVKGFGRILRCNPVNKGGYDPVI